MPVRFNKPSDSPKFYNILVPMAGMKYKAAIGYDEQFHLSTPLHYLKDLGRCTPCLHEECVHCAKFIPTRNSTYVPAMIWYGPKKGWFNEILPVTDSWREILRQDLTRFYYNFQRKGGRTSQIMWNQGDRKEENAVDFPGFDVERSLYRAWGMGKGKAGPPASD